MIPVSSTAVGSLRLFTVASCCFGITLSLRDLFHGAAYDRYDHIAQKAECEFEKWPKIFHRAMMRSVRRSRKTFWIAVRAALAGPHLNASFFDGRLRPQYPDMDVDNRVKETGFMFDPQVEQELAVAAELLLDIYICRRSRRMDAPSSRVDNVPLTDDQGRRKLCTVE